MPSPLPGWCDRIAVFDVETTGLDVREARIVTAHIATLASDGSLHESHSWLADPGVPIPPIASAIHGVTNEIARRDGRDAATVIGEIVTVLGDLLAENTPLVVYNAPYDLSLLHFEALRYGIPPLHSPSPIVDPLVIDKAVDRYRKGKRTLSVAAEHYGVPLTAAHDASADAIAAGLVTLKLAEHFPEVLDVSAGELHDLQIGWSAEQAASFQDYMRRTRNPNFVTSGVWPVRT